MLLSIYTYVCALYTLSTQWNKFNFKAYLNVLHTYQYNNKNTSTNVKRFFPYPKNKIDTTNYNKITTKKEKRIYFIGL